jgi:hypothetical protein
MSSQLSLPPSSFLPNPSPPPSSPFGPFHHHPRVLGAHQHYDSVITIHTGDPDIYDTNNTLGSNNSNNHNAMSVNSSDDHQNTPSQMVSAAMLPYITAAADQSRHQPYRDDNTNIDHSNANDSPDNDGVIEPLQF